MSSALRPRSTYTVVVPDDLFLFDDEPLDAPDAAEKAPSTTPVAAWQVDLLRGLLDSRGFQSMAERQQAVEAVVGHPVESLRALTHEEALQAVEELGKSAPPARSTSAWDDRDENTWIDRL